MKLDKDQLKKTIKDLDKRFNKLHKHITTYRRPHFFND